MPGKHKHGTNDADGDGKKGGSLPEKLTPDEEAALARQHNEGPEQP